MFLYSLIYPLPSTPWTIRSSSPPSEGWASLALSSSLYLPSQSAPSYPHIVSPIIAMQTTLLLFFLPTSDTQVATHISSSTLTRGSRSSSRQGQPARVGWYIKIIRIYVLAHFGLGSFCAVCTVHLPTCTQKPSTSPCHSQQWQKRTSIFSDKNSLFAFEVWSNKIVNLHTETLRDIILL
jgi:hypothetical protein